MRKSEFSEEMVIGILKEQHSGLGDDGKATAKGGL